MIAKGASHEEAGRAWVEAYTGQGRTTAAVEEPWTSGRIEENREKAEKRAQIIADYGRFIERNPMAGEIRDLTCLPHDKKAILDAICLEIVSAEDERRLETLKVGALFLADFQEGVGDQPLSSLGVDLSSIDANSMSAEALRALAHKIAGNPDRERFNPSEAAGGRAVPARLARRKEEENAGLISPPLQPLTRVGHTKIASPK